MEDNVPQDSPKKISTSSVITLAVIGALLAVFVGVVLFYPAGEKSDKGEESSFGRRPADGSIAPGFSLPDINGKQWTLSELRGKAVVVNFWATWCPPCRMEMPSLSALNERLTPGGNFVILSILYRDNPETAKAYFEKNGYAMPILLDPDSSVARAYGITAVPETFIIDKKGVLRKKIIGPSEFDTPDALAFYESLAGE